MTLASAFSQIPSTRRIPLFAAEFQATKKGTQPSFVNPSIILAQKLPAASAVASTRYLVSSVGQAASLFGRGSPAHLMARAFFRNNPAGVLYIAAQTDNSGTAASQTLTYTGPATDNGTIYLYVGGVLVEVGVADEDTAAEIATATVDAITAMEDLPVTAAVGGGGSEHIVTFTCKVEGTVGNLVTLALNPLGQAGGQELPAGVGATLGAATLAGGATDPTVANWTASLGDEPFDHIALQFDAAAAVAELKATLASRWDATYALDGQLYIAKGDSQADLLTYAGVVNAETVSVASYKEGVGWLTPSYEVAAAYMGLASRRLANDPAAPIHLQPLVGVWAYGTNFTDTERDALANGGCATLVARGGSVFVEFEATTRRQDAFGEDDTTYEVIQTPATLSRLRRRFGFDIQGAFAEHKLVNDGTSFGEGQKIVTPSILKGFIISRYRQYVADGVVEDVEGFAEQLIVERNASNPNRVDGYLPPNLANQFRVFAGIIGFSV